MVLKIKTLKFIILFFLTVLLIIGASFSRGKIETNLLKTLLPNSIPNSNSIVTLADKNSSIIKVVFESDNSQDLEYIKTEFTNAINKNDFDIYEINISKLIKKYLSQPTNFLSDKSRKLLKSKDYTSIHNNAIEGLYAPASIQLTSLEKDPYLLLDEFLMSSKSSYNTDDYINDKCYDTLTLKLKNKEGLSPDLCNTKISKLVKVQKKFSNKTSKIYLAGTPVHSYYTSKNSVASINLICLFSTFLIIFLTYFYFKEIKILIPIFLSICYGLLSGFVITKLWFNDFQIITMVFSTTLIGIGIDYSYHYCFTKNIDKTFVKNLTLSLLTTVLPFLFLYLTQIELLQQISIFTTFGLVAIYLFILIYYPEFNITPPKAQIKFNYKFYKNTFLILLIIGTIGLLKIKTNDSLTSLYVPSKKLLKAETLYNQISNNTSKDCKIIKIKGTSFDDLLKKEEKVTEELADKNINYYSLSKFIPSIEKQKENYSLVKELYKADLKNYLDILSPVQKQSILNKKFTPIVFNIEEYPYLSNFLVTPSTSCIFAFTNNKIYLKENHLEIIDIKSQIEGYLKDYRHKLIKIFPAILGLLIVLFLGIYGLKRGVKILIPPILATILAIGLTSILGFEFNLFSTISLFLILGFTIDYSIFRDSNNTARKNIVTTSEQTEDAIFISCLTTSCSFLLLALSGFKLLSSISWVLFFGLIISYLSGYLIFKQNDI